MQLSLYRYVILLKCVEETESMKADSATLQLLNYKKQHMDKCVFIVIRP